ncbi:MAG: hypothetical protein ACOYNR_07685 [Blastocatellia bacterium]
MRNHTFPDRGEKEVVPLCGWGGLPRGQRGLPLDLRATGMLTGV